MECVNQLGTFSQAQQPFHGHSIPSNNCADRGEEVVERHGLLLDNDRHGRQVVREASLDWKAVMTKQEKEEYKTSTTKTYLGDMIWMLVKMTVD